LTSQHAPLADKGWAYFVPKKCVLTVAKHGN
jgi:hypothetical protein